MHGQTMGAQGSGRRGRSLGQRGRAGFRPTVERLEDRLTPANLPSGFTEAAVASGLSSATAMELAPDGRLWVLEQAGDVQVFHNGSTTGFNALHIASSAITSSGERGLLGIAFDPTYDVTTPAPDFVYLYYTSTASPNPHNRISRFTVNNSNPDQPTLGSETVIFNLDALSSATNHNGGAIHFGPDGKLYVAVGDNANGANAQSLSTVMGKMLRINADGTIPTDDPFFGQTTGNNRAIWALGLRNPFTFTFQPGTGRMHINDVGQNTWEEIDVGAAGANYGWPTTEGDFTQSQFPNFTRPFYTYSHGSGTFQGFAITGGAFYNPSSPGANVFPSSYNGDYFFADYVNNWINVIDVSSGAVSSFATNAPGTVDVHVAPDGSLYYLARNQSQAFRVIYTGNQAPNITQGPASQTVSVGGSATFTVSATGTAPLSYQWQRAESGTSTWGNISGATSSTYILSNAQLSDNGDRFRVIVSNASGNATSAPATLTVTSNQPPSATITINSGLTNGKFVAGQAIGFSGSATDPEDGTLGASRFTWRVDYITSIASGNPAVRPFVQPFSGQTSGNFTPATTGPYTLTDVAYRIVLTVTDSGGLSTTTQVDVDPNVATLTVTASPSGLTVTVDGQPFTAPHTFASVVGFQRPLGAPLSQTLNDTLYNFSQWSDLGPATHTISTPATNTTYTATYQPLQITTLVGGDRQAFALDAQGTLWRIRNGVYTNAGFGGLEIAVSNVGDDNPSNDIVFLRDAGSKLWFWNQTYWTDTGGYVPSLKAGDNQVFSVGFDHQIWRYRVMSGWTASGGYGVELAVGSTGDANPANDVVFLRGYHQGDPAAAAGSAIWVWNQSSWWFTGGWLPSLVAGDSQVFAVGFDNQVWRYRVTGAGTGFWSASGGFGISIAVADAGDANPANDLVFLRASDNTIWLWTQTSWANLGQQLTTLRAGDDQVFGLDANGELKRYRAANPAGWTASGFMGGTLAVDSVLDGTASDDVAFLLLADGSVKTWRPG